MGDGYWLFPAFLYKTFYKIPIPQCTRIIIYRTMQSSRSSVFSLHRIYSRRNCIWTTDGGHLWQVVRSLIGLYSRKLRRLSLESSHNDRYEHITAVHSLHSLGVNGWVKIETSRALVSGPRQQARVGAEWGRISVTRVRVSPSENVLKVKHLYAYFCCIQR